MKLFRFSSVVLLLLATQTIVHAQSYKTAAGIRIDNGINLTLQQYITNGWTGEGILHTSFASEDLGLTILAEKHQKILFRNLNLYYGVGGHYYWQNEARDARDEPVENVAGISLIGGAELSIGRLNFAVDWKPELHLSGETVHPFDWNGAAISVRYIFAKRERKGIKDWKAWDRFEKDKKKRRK